MDQQEYLKAKHEAQQNIRKWCELDEVARPFQRKNPNDLTGDEADKIADAVVFWNDIVWPSLIKALLRERQFSREDK